MSDTKLKIAQPKPTIRMMPFTDQIAPYILSWASNKENVEFFRRCPPMCNWGTVELIRQLFGNMWVVYEEDQPIGLAGIFALDQYSRSCEFGLLIDKEHCTDRPRACNEICNQVGQYCFNYMNLHKVNVRVLPWRQTLAKYLEAHGFAKECDLRDSCFMNGEYHSEGLYSCLKLEFKEI